MVDCRASNWNHVTDKAEEVISWSPNNRFSSYKLDIVERLVPRYWFVVLANCEPFQSVDVEVWPPL